MSENQYAESTYLESGPRAGEPGGGDGPGPGPGEPGPGEPGPGQPGQGNQFGPGQPGNQFGPGPEPGEQAPPGPEPGEQAPPGGGPGEPAPGAQAPGAPAGQQAQDINPAQPFNVAPPAANANEVVRPASDPRIDTLIDRLTTLAGNIGQNANSASPEAKSDTFTTWMTGCMGIGAVVAAIATAVGAEPAAAKILSRIEAKIKGTSVPDLPGATTAQQQAVDDAVAAWTKLTDAQIWTAMAQLVQSQKLTYLQQTLLVNYLVQTHPPSPPLTWDSDTKMSLLKSLSQLKDDSQMYTQVAAYTYQGAALPFDVAGSVIVAALALKHVGLNDI